MVRFAEINQAPSPYSMLQHIGRVETPDPVPRNCLRYLEITLIMGEGDWYCRTTATSKTELHESRYLMSQAAPS